MYSYIFGVFVPAKNMLNMCAACKQCRTQSVRRRRRDLLLSETIVITNSWRRRSTVCRRRRAHTLHMHAYTYKFVRAVHTVYTTDWTVFVSPPIPSKSQYDFNSCALFIPTPISTILLVSHKQQHRTNSPLYRLCVCVCGDKGGCRTSCHKNTYHYKCIEGEREIWHKNVLHCFVD